MANRCLNPGFVSSKIRIASTQAYRAEARAPIDLAKVVLIFCDQGRMSGNVVIMSSEKIG